MLSLRESNSDNTPYEKIGDEVRSLADEVPFDIPDSWEWVRLGSAFAIEMGQSPAGNTVSGNCFGTEFHQGKVFFGEKYIKASDQYTSSPTKFAPENSVLLCVRAPVGKVNITDRELCIGRGLCAIIPLAGMPLLFAYYLLAAYENIFVKQATGTTFVAITAETVKNQLIPMPPLAEQQRIADLIKRLIPYVDEYGKAESAVDQLNCHFPEALKKSILQEAVQGKLVPQDPSDEPTEALLERIRAEKQRLIKEGKIKKGKHESAIFRRDNSHYEKRGSEEACIDDELPFDIPSTWMWCRLCSLLTQASTGPFGSMLHKEDYTPSGVPLVNPANITNGCIISTKLKYVSPMTAQRLESYRLHPSDVIIGRRGEMGRSAVVQSSQGEWLCGTGCFFVTPCSALAPEYLVFLLGSPYVKSVLMAASVGTTMNNLNHSVLGDILIPLPPFDEQLRIMKKYVEAVTLLDV